MELPALLPENLTKYSQAKDDNSLLLEIRTSIADLIPFIATACNDETWSEKHAHFMKKAIEVLTRRMFRQKLLTVDGQAIAGAIRQHWGVLKDIVPTDLRVEYDGVTYDLNTLLFVADSGYLKYLVISQCADKDRKSFTLIDPPFDKEFFQLYLAFAQQGDLPDLWQRKSEELLVFLKMAVDMQCEPLEKLASETYRRYLDNKNAFSMILYAYECNWKQLFHICADYINSIDEGITFLTNFSGFAIQLHRLDDTTISHFEVIHSAITHLACKAELAQSPLLPELVDKCHALHSLDVSEALKGEQILKALNKRLEILDLTLSEWVDVDTLEKVIAACPHLSKLSLAHNIQLNYRALGTLYKLKELRILDLSGCYQMTDADFKMVLHGCPNLIELYLSECKKLPDAAFISLARLLRHLRVLDVSKCLIADRALVEIFFRCHDLTTLIMKECPNLTEKSLQGVNPIIKIIK